MAKLAYKAKAKVLDVFGDIKVYPWPMFIVYSPKSFLVKGEQTRIAESILLPGDIIQRKYTCYLDGKFIPGKYSHTGVYIGNGLVVHAISEGVSTIDVIDFLRCDAFCIIRAKDYREKAVELALHFLGRPYDFSFESTNKRIYCHELGKHCYPDLIVEPQQPTLFGFTFGMQKKFLSESFLNSPDFHVVYEYYPIGKKKSKKSSGDQSSALKSFKQLDSKSYKDNYK